MRLRTLIRLLLACLPLLLVLCIAPAVLPAAAQQPTPAPTAIASPMAGELVGTTLTQLGFATPESMRASLGVLAEQLLAPLDAEHIGVLLPRLHLFQAACAAGLFAAARQQADAAHEQNCAALVAAQAAVQAQREVAEDRLGAILALVPLVLFATDQQGVITFATGRGLAALGIAATDLIGQAIEALTQQPEVVAAVHAAQLGDVVTLLVQDGGRIFEARYAPLTDDTGAISGVIGVAQDVSARPLPVALPTSLTSDDHSLLALLSGGQSTPQIAATLKISPKAVEKRLGKLYDKIGVNNRIEAVVWALRAGLI